MTTTAPKAARSTGHRTIFAIVALAILAVPLIAMQLTDEVAWTVSDFVAAGGLLLMLGIGIDLAIRHLPSRPARIGAIVLALAVFAGVWGVLATG